MTDTENLKGTTEMDAVGNRSTHFFSLRGFPGILVGIYALLGAITFRQLLNNHQNLNSAVSFLPISYLEYLLTSIVFLVLVISIISVYISAFRKAKRSHKKLWGPVSRRFLIHVSLPLLAGGVICILLYEYGLIRYISSAMLIFYGLTFFSARKYISNTTRNAGIVILLIGLVSTQFIDYGLYFWVIGFGFIHVIYGIVTYRKHDNP